MEKAIFTKIIHSVVFNRRESQQTSFSGAVHPTRWRKNATRWCAAVGALLQLPGTSFAKKMSTSNTHSSGIIHADEPAMVVAAALEILGDVKDAKTVEALIAASRKGPVAVRSRVFEALGKCRAESGLVRLREGLVEKDLELRIMAAVALGRAEDARSVPYLAEVLSAPDWPVRAAAASALARIGSKEAIPNLILQLGREQGRLREDMRLGLEWLGKVRGGLGFEGWLRWYEKQGKTLDYDRGEIRDEPARPTVIYHGIPTWAERVVFVLDVSKSMREEVKVNVESAIPEDVRKAGGADLARWEAMKTKIEWARAHLEHAIRTMSPEVEFGLLTYNHGVTPVFGGKLVRATPDNKAKAISRVESLSPSGDTDLFNALSRALRIPHGDLLGKNLVDGPGTIYFLTDGFSTSGEFQEEEGYRIFEEIQRANLRRRIRFNCIGMGLHDGDLLSNLSLMGGKTGEGVYASMK